MLRSPLFLPSLRLLSMRKCAISDERMNIPSPIPPPRSRSAAAAAAAATAAAR